MVYVVNEMLTLNINNNNVRKSCLQIIYCNLVHNKYMNRFFVYSHVQRELIEKIKAVRK